MKVLVYPHDLAIGGSQLNAIEIAATLDRMGHSTVLFGAPGPLVSTIEALGLEFVAAPEMGRRPSLAVAGALRSLVRSRGIDIVHGYEWPPALEAHLATRGRSQAIAVATVMSMAVAPFIPRTVPLVVGTEQIAAAERLRGRTRVSVIEPPVDIESNSPQAAEGLDLQGFRRQWGITGDRYTIVCVTRLAHQLKLEGLLTAIDVVGRLSGDLPTQLVIVGDGTARDIVKDRAEAVNARVGAGTVVLTGELSDPRAAYAVADVTLGMGGSALRSLAFAKPLIVQGEQGFWSLLTPLSLPQFLWTGWYGYGTGPERASDELTRILAAILPDESRRRELGAFGRQVIEERFSLQGAAHAQLAMYEAALESRGSHVESASEDVAAAGKFVTYYARRKVSARLGRRAADDFNANPVARSQAQVLAPSASTDDGHRDDVVLYFSGVSWDAVTGTDKLLVQALSSHRSVIWVDSPTSWLRRGGEEVPMFTSLGPGLVRVHPIGPPGISRAGVRRVASWLTSWRARQAVKRVGRDVSAIVVSSPAQLMPRSFKGATKIYYETDDFVAGAGLMGMPVPFAERCRDINLSRSDVLMAVSGDLATSLSRPGKEAVAFPNGCNPELYADVDSTAPAAEITLTGPVAGVIGQFNDRLDLDLLEAVADAGASLLLVGPRHKASEAARARLDQLIARPDVEWFDRQPLERLPEFMAQIKVGLTPYQVSDFNRASLPLKTLEYLSAGRPAVSIDLPAYELLRPHPISTVTGVDDFVRTTMELLAAEPDEAAARRRREFANANSWDARATRLVTLMRRR